MKVALIKVPPTYSDWDKRLLLGISYISAYLNDQGINCRIFDANFHLWSETELINIIVEYNPEIVGFTAMTYEIVRCSQIASRIKEKLNVPIVIGGCHVTALPERTLKEFPVFDYGVYGEGEKTMLELVKFIDQNNSSRPENINGIIYKDTEEKIRINSPGQLLSSSELDELPFPDFRDYYCKPGALSGKDSYYVLFTSRGCPFNCAFCMQVMGRLIRQRSTEGVVKEIEYAISHLGAHTIDFSDEIFLFNNKRTRELLQLIIDRNLHKRVKWSGLTRANLVTSEIVGLAKKGGCFRIGIGVESGDDGILKEIRGKILTRTSRNQKLEPNFLASIYERVKKYLAIFLHDFIIKGLK